MDAAMTQAWDFIDANILWQRGNTIFDYRIRDCELSVRTTNALMNDDIATVRELLEKPPSHLLRIPAFGRKSLREVETFLNDHGLRLAEW
jgi:DNA-directed RNA polymerase alpha subunit